MFTLWIEYFTGSSIHRVEKRDYDSWKVVNERFRTALVSFVNALNWGSFGTGIAVSPRNRFEKKSNRGFVHPDHTWWKCIWEAVVSIIYLRGIGRCKFRATPRLLYETVFVFTVLIVQFPITIIVYRPFPYKAMTCTQQYETCLKFSD